MTLPDRMPAVYTAGQPTPFTDQTTTIEAYGARMPEYAGERRIVGYERHAGMLLPVYEAVQPSVPQQPRDLTPQPLFDPKAQRIAAGGLLAGGAGWGGGQVLMGASQFVSAMAGAGTLLAWIAAAVIVSRVAPALLGAGRTTVNNTTNVTNENRWLGRSNTTVR